MGCAESVLRNRGFGINETKSLYERVIVQMALNRAATWGMRSDE